jgi:PTH2 family peptidyl-tRNA hydrolase
MQSIFPKSTPSEHKVVLCVRDDLKMGIGKIAAQCCHATLGNYKLISTDSFYRPLCH